MMEQWKPVYFADVAEDDLFWETMKKDNLDIREMSDYHVYKVVIMLEKYRAKIPRLMQVRFDKFPKTHPEFYL